MGATICCKCNDKPEISNNKSNSEIKNFDDNLEFINFIHLIFKTPLNRSVNFTCRQKIFVLDFDGPTSEFHFKNSYLNNTFGLNHDLKELYITNYKILSFVLYILYINNVIIVNGSQRITMNNTHTNYRDQMYDILDESFGINRFILSKKISKKISNNIDPILLNDSKVLLLDSYFNHFFNSNKKLLKKNIFLIDDNIIYQDSAIQAGFSFILCKRSSNDHFIDNFYLVDMLRKGLDRPDIDILFIIKDLCLKLPKYSKYIYRLHEIFAYFCDKNILINI